MPKIKTEICDICRKEVFDDHQALLCDKCNIWKHRECLSMANKTYVKLSKSTDEWICGKCNIKDGHGSSSQAKRDYTLADVMAKLEQMEKEYKSLLTKYNQQLKINEHLQDELGQIKQQLNKNEQKELKKNLLVQGIPYKENENLPDIINKIGNYLDVPGGNKFTAFRLGRDKNKSSVKVIFEDELTKTKFLKSRKKFDLKSSDLGFTTDNKIFMNHELTKTNLELYMAAKVFKKDRNFKFLWIGDGNIFLRKDENSKVLLINSKSQLEN